MTSLPAIVRPCLNEAIRRGARLMERAADHAAEQLQDQAARGSGDERKQVAEAVTELAVQRAGWISRFPQLLRTALENPARGGTSGPTLRPSSLTLVDDEEVAQSIESARLALQLASRLEEPLAELDALMSAALGLEGIRPEENPLRPEVFAQVLRTTMAGPHTTPAFLSCWMRNMTAPVAQELEPLYRSCARLLVQARVQAASYRVLTTPGALGPRATRPGELGGFRGEAPATPAAAFARAGTTVGAFVAQALNGPRLAEFLFRGSPQVHQPLDDSYYAQVEQELAHLEAAPDDDVLPPQLPSSYAQLPAVDRPMREVGTERPLSSLWGALSAPRERSLLRTRLKQQAQDVGQVMGLEAVRQLVDQVARDPRLLAPVREAIVALEPPLARLAMQSPRFFGEQQNPARQLIERVAERSLRYNDEFAAPFQSFFAEVGDRFKALNDVEDLRDAAPFQQALGELEANWSAEDAQEVAQRERLVSAVEAAQKRQAMASEIAGVLSQRSDMDGVPAIVQEFLYERWALVMAHARLQDGEREIDPGGYGAVVTDLLWSVKRDGTLNDPARAFELIPRVVGKLRSGLEGMGETVDENDPFFKGLERLHRPVLKLRAKHRRQAFAAPSEFAADADLAPSAAQPPEAPEELWLAPDELKDFGFQDTVATPTVDDAAIGADDAQGRPSGDARAPADPIDADAVIDGLQEGAWVDLYSRKDWRRARLSWASSRATLFMFVSQGGTPHSMTRRTLHRLISDRLLRPIEGHEVVQHAIEVLATPDPEQLAA